MGYGGGCGASKEQVAITEAPVAQSQTPVKVIDAPATKQVSTKQKQTSVTTPANNYTAPTPGPTNQAVAKTEYTNQEANNNMVQGHTKIKTSLSATKLEQTTEADFGSMFFKGAVADRYLKAQGLSGAILDDSSWPSKHADQVAAAVMKWGQDNQATNFTHWFQPLGASGVRHGLTGQVHNNMFTFGSDGQPKYKFTGSELCFGETDGSSYPNGGLRATHTAGGYTIIDATSPIFMREDTIYIPTIFASWTGFALDEKIPLLRSCESLSKEGVRFLSKFGHTASAVQPNIGLEQEFFFVPRDLYAKRLDLVMAGRTVMGKDPPRGQEMCDHYMGPPNQHAMECIREIQKEAFLMGIPLKTRHREVAPNQYEFAPYFGFVTTQIDQNLMVMQIAEEVAARYNLAVLLQEKPFNGVNGSGKHNNWSIGTPEGLNLFNAGQVAETLKSKDAFPAIMACIVQGVNRHGDLMRAAIANPGNDFRLGACEAPPAIISTYLGDSLTEYLKAYMEGSDAEYKPEKRPLDTGISFIPSFSVPSEDRNRTSPFPYGGHRFEFRAVGSAQNVSLVNVVLNALTTEAMKEFSDKVDAGQSIKDVTIAMLKENFKAVFNGNGYAESWKDEAVSRGIWRIDSGVEALEHLTSDKNKAMFKALNILGDEELTAKRDVHLDHYTNTVEIECLAMIDMMQQQVIPAIKEAKMATGDLEAGVKKLQEGIKGVHAGADSIAKARLARVLRLETMVAVRETCDTAEATCPAHLWPMPNYTQLLFLDQTTDAFGNTIATK